MSMRRFKRRLVRTMNVKRTGYMTPAQSANGKACWWSYLRNLRDVRLWQLAKQRGHLGIVTEVTVGGKRVMGRGTFTINHSDGIVVHVETL